MDVGKRIAAWREAKGLTQHQLAERVDVTYAAVFQWEGGSTKKVRPSLASVERIAKALNLTMEEFYGPLPSARKKAS